MEVELEMLTASHEKDKQMLDVELDVELTLQKEGVSNAITGLVAEDIRSSGLKHLSEVVVEFVFM